MHAVELKNVSRHFGPVKAVDGVDLSIAPGEFFAMLGPSGSGKTTCLRLIAGFETPTAGDVALFGASLAGVPPYRRDVNTVFQDYALFPHMSVLDNVAYGLMVKGVRRRERERAAEEALELVKLPGYGARRPSQLSGGQRQRVALARALVNRPKVLLLDEPLGALDLKLREEMQEELKVLQQALKITFVLVTHDQGEALSMADRVAVFRDGRIAQLGRPEEIHDRPRTRFVAEFVGSANVLGPEASARLGLGRRWTSLRPEALSPEPAAGTAVVALAGRLVAENYLGALKRVALDWHGQRLHALLPTRRTLVAPGEPLTLHARAADFNPLEDAP